MTFSEFLVRWQRAHGRHDLPWQVQRSPYAVWLSEIMLQQTQVQTVRAYFLRFIRRFPDVASLAAAELDEVLGLWSGLGYYSRARNLHRCARIVVEEHGGVFPQRSDVLKTLPGIGPSTAAAIAAICFGERVPILDGNVKRVLTRFLGFDADLGCAAGERALLELAQNMLPHSDLARSMPVYTQAVMDLGALVCTPRQPACHQCPVADGCYARSNQCPERFPVKARKMHRTAQTLFMLLAQAADGAAWLSQRPVPGVWGGLYCLPLFESEDALREAVPLRQRPGLQPLPGFKHALTHKDLWLNPIRLVCETPVELLTPGRWIPLPQRLTLGMPAPVKRLLVSHSHPAPGAASA